MQKAGKPSKPDASLGYIEKPCVKKITKIKNKPETLTIQDHQSKPYVIFHYNPLIFIAF